MTEEEVSSVPLEEPGYCPSRRTRNVAECYLANKKHQFVVATGYEVSQGQNLCGHCVLAFELGQLLSRFLYGNPVETVALSLA